MYLKLGRVPAARAVFDAMACRNVMSFNILIGGLIHNGDINAARKLFDEMPERNLATWNAMIAGLAHFELDEEGLECFLRSRREGLRPDEFGSGRQIHAFVVINGFEQDMCVGSSLAHMYMRSGHLEEGERVLRGLPFLNVVSCHTVIAGRAQNGDPEGAFHHFILMKNVGLLPDHISLMENCYFYASESRKLEEQQQQEGPDFSHYN
ncbi:pentatricopeptide repeat-containing protein At2g41080-like [Zingiber officinale]|uniref:pentatricopeptide repeat-containing protein At2g41080-like n=1 Tax=Zingiber officinale TaxID=94328 RepID=UPI001C4B6480|nr:pentatricopeptide repeat-containing protein At2g41080-like [Zingiber officinale]